MPARSNGGPGEELKKLFRRTNSVPGATDRVLAIIGDSLEHIPVTNVVATGLANLGAGTVGAPSAKQTGVASGIYFPPPTSVIIDPVGHPTDPDWMTNGVHVGIVAGGVEVMRFARAFGLGDWGDPRFFEEFWPDQKDAGRWKSYLRWDAIHHKFNVTSVYMIEVADTPEVGMFRFEGTRTSPTPMTYGNDADDFIGNIYGMPFGATAGASAGSFTAQTAGGYVAGIGRVGEYYTRIVETPDETNRGGAHSWSVTPKGSTAIPAQRTFAVHRMALMHNGGLKLFGNGPWEDHADDITTRVAAMLQASSGDAKGVLHIIMPKHDAGLLNIRQMDKYNHAGDGMAEYFNYGAGVLGTYYLATTNDYNRVSVLSVDISDQTVKLGKNLPVEITPAGLVKIGGSISGGGTLQVSSTTGVTPFDLNRPEDGKFEIYRVAGTEIGSMGSVAGSVTLTGSSQSHYAQLAGKHNAADLRIGEVLSVADDEMCEWRNTEWEHPITGDLCREAYTGPLPIGAMFEAKIEIEPAKPNSLVFETTPDGRQTPKAVIKPVLDDDGKPKIWRRKTGQKIMSKLLDAQGNPFTEDVFEEIPVTVAENITEDIPAVIATVTKTVVEEPNVDYPKVVVTDVAADPRVYGVFGGYDPVDNDLVVICGGSGRALVKGPVSTGQYLESAGGGVARAQVDKGRHAGTLGKVRVSDDVKDTNAVRLLPVDVSIG